MQDDVKMQQWIDILEEDEDYDSEFLIKIINHKLKSMNEYPWQDESITSTINKCLELGDKIMTHNYGEKADEMFPKDFDPTGDEFALWREESDRAVANRLKDLDKYVYYLGKFLKYGW